MKNKAIREMIRAEHNLSAYHDIDVEFVASIGEQEEYLVTWFNGTYLHKERVWVESNYTTQNLDPDNRIPELEVLPGDNLNCTIERALNYGGSFPVRFVFNGTEVIITSRYRAPELINNAVINAVQNGVKEIRL